MHLDGAGRTARLPSDGLGRMRMDNHVGEEERPRERGIVLDQAHRVVACPRSNRPELSRAGEGRLPRDEVNRRVPHGDLRPHAVEGHGGDRREGRDVLGRRHMDDLAVGDDDRIARPGRSAAVPVARQGEAAAVFPRVRERRGRKADG